MSAAAESTVQIDNARVRVTEWRLPPGAAVGHHRHAYDYVVVPMTTGRLLLKEGGGEQVAELEAGRSYTRQAGVEHDVINVNEFPFTFIDIELK